VVLLSEEQRQSLLDKSYQLRKAPELKTEIGTVHWEVSYTVTLFLVFARHLFTASAPTGLPYWPNSKELSLKSFPRKSKGMPKKRKPGTK